MGCETATQSKRKVFQQCYRNFSSSKPVLISHALRHAFLSFAWSYTHDTASIMREARQSSGETSKESTHGPLSLRQVVEGELDPRSSHFCIN